MLQLRPARETTALSETTVHRFSMSAAATIVAALTGFVACGDGDSLSDADSAVAGGVPRSMQIISETEGWVLTDERLLLSTDAANEWMDVTPPDMAGRDIRGVTFLDFSNGWVVASGNSDSSGATQLVSAHTADSGAIWAMSTVGTPDVAYSLSRAGAAYLSFVDSKHGWLLLQLATGIQFSGGELFRTRDGGGSWEKIEPPPIAGPIAFVDESTGIMTGGAAGDKAFVTHDGGDTWQAALLPVSPELTSAYPRYEAPLFESPQIASIPASFASAGSSQSFVGLYSTRDGGQSWELASKVAWPDTIEIESLTPLDAVGSGGLIAVESDGGKVVTVTDDQQKPSVISPNGLPAGVIDVDFISGQVGWALVQTNTCLSEKSNCVQSASVYSTSDSGQTWTQLNLP